MVLILDERLDIPPEVIDDIGFWLLASNPFASLAPIVPLLQTSKEWYAALSPKSKATLYARLCHLKFDVAAVKRRAFTPTNFDLTAHLVEACRTLKVIRNGDIFHENVDSALLNALLMMFHDDGKNRVQLEFSGIVPFIDQFIRLRLHEEKETNDMWPVENVRNSAALWLSWLFTTKEQLENETVERRSEFRDLVLPFLICPMRYASAYAPSNHFILPLTEEVPLFQTSTRHGPFPVYHAKQQKATDIPFFHSRTSVLIPPVSAAATLLFWSRREIQPFFQIPTSVPRNRVELEGRPGLTVDDLVEFNSFKAAKLRSVVRWDWDSGGPMSLLEDGSREPCAQVPSKQWDMDWWRMRMCQNVLWKQPRWRLGNVYQRGLLTGLWQGVYFLSNADSFTEVLRNASYPDVVSGSFKLLPRPIFMRLQEHNFVRGAGVSQAATATRKPPRAPHPVAIPPISAPAIHAKGEEGECLIPGDPSINNAWIPGAIGGLQWSSDPETTLVPSVEREQDPVASSSVYARSVGAMSSTRFHIAPASTCAPRSAPNDNQTPEVQDSRTFAHYNGYYLYEAFEPGKRSVHERMGETACRCEDSSNVSRVVSYQGCPRCAERQAYLDEVRQRESLGESMIPEPVVTDEVEGFFKDIGMGRRGSDGSFDLNLTPRISSGSTSTRPAHDPGRIEVCNDGIEDTIVTGGLDERHRLAWGDAIYYGRVRPWDGMVAILRQQGPDDPRNHGQYLFYGYIYGGDTFVGNWRYAGGDPLVPAFEAPFVMSRRSEDPISCTGSI